MDVAGSAGKKSTQPIVSIKTFPWDSPSEQAEVSVMRPKWESVAGSSGGRSEQLRQMARTEAQALARSIARRHGWTLTGNLQKGSVWRDETATALRELPAI